MEEILHIKLIDFDTPRCGFCGKPLPKHKVKNGYIYCNTGCAQAGQVKNNNPNNVPPATVGAMALYRCTIDLLQKKYEVFLAASPSCSCDLVALKNGKLTKIESRTMIYDAKSKPRKTYRGVKHRADVLAAVYPDKVIYSPKLP